MKEKREKILPIDPDAVAYPKNRENGFLIKLMVDVMFADAPLI